MSPAVATALLMPSPFDDRSWEPAVVTAAVMAVAAGVIAPFSTTMGAGMLPLYLSNRTPEAMVTVNLIGGPASRATVRSPATKPECVASAVLKSAALEVMSVEEMVSPSKVMSMLPAVAAVPMSMTASTFAPEKITAPDAVLSVVP